MTKVIKGLEQKGCVIIGDTTREGTLYTVILPLNVPMVKEKIKSQVSQDETKDYFTDPRNRLAVFERDNWTCQYCGEKVTSENATLDHYVPQSKGDTHAKTNLRTCCLVCNGIKSGRSFEEAAPSILKSVQERRQQSEE